MATYGKKKRSILPSFASLRDFRDSDTVPKPKKDKSKMQVSKSFISMPSLQENSRQYQPRDDSIEEMASMLLDDTTMDQLNMKTEPGRRLSQTAAAEIFNNFGRMGSGDDKVLPHLPRLIFNGDDAWALKATPVVTAAGSSNQMSFNGDSGSLVIPTQSTNHSRKASAPAIPRKSSKRRSGRPRSHLHTLEKKSAVVSKDALKARISPPKPINLAPQKPFTGGIDINEKVQAMLAATKALKGDDGSLLPGPLVPHKKRRFADYKVLAKMKTVISDRFPGISSRKKEAVQEGRLLNDIGDEGQDFQEDVSASAAALTTMDTRVNGGGDNFKNPKIFTLTGHGNVPRKPLAEDGKSLRSRKSVDDPFSEQPQPCGISRVPTSFEARLRDDMSIDDSRENPQDLPNGTETPKHCTTSMKRASVFTDFDAILSSSPVAQSTPRIRLEPSFGESGKKVLKNVPADSRSVFDFEVDSVSDMELEDAASHKVSMRFTTSTTGTPIRKVSQAKRYSGVGVRGLGSKRMKKHPSPSKADLELLQHAMRDFPRVSSEAESPTILSVLSPKDVNVLLQDSKQRTQVCHGNKKIENSDFAKATASMPKIQKRIPQQEDKHNAFDDHRSSSQSDIADLSSMMDIDELQWDQTAYHIGMRAVV